MNTPSTPSMPKHFLFMLPGTTTLEEQNEVVAAARQLLTEGYVYVASAHERTMEDRESIRFMPLRTSDLPCFGTVTGVMVARDRELARLAKHVYAGAPVMVFDPADASQAELTDTEQATVSIHSQRPTQPARVRVALREAA